MGIYYRSTKPLVAPLVLGLIAARIGQSQEELARLQREALQRRLGAEIDRFFTLTLDALAIIDWESGDRKSTRLNSSHSQQSRMPSSA